MIWLKSYLKQCIIQNHLRKFLFEDDSFEKSKIQSN